MRYSQYLEEDREVWAGVGFYSAGVLEEFDKEDLVEITVHGSHEKEDGYGGATNNN